MKIVLITGSRSDRNALEMVHTALLPSHQIAWHEVGVASGAVAAKDAAYTTASAVEYVTNYLRDDPPDLAILHGDRHEILGAAVATNVMGIPIAHLGGGDITEGSQDDCFRHAITKLSHLHFPTNQDAADRIIQMGEEPDRVHVVGDAGIDMVMATPLLGREETFAAVGLTNPYKVILVLFHPNTLLGDTAAELEALSVALARRTETLVLLGPNADAGSDIIRQEWQRFVRKRVDNDLSSDLHTVYHDNVEPQVFYSLLKHCDVLIGNSSAGFYEAPCLGIPVVNIGDRQTGRPPHMRLFNATAETGTIFAAIQSATFYESQGGRQFRRPVANPYGDGHAAERIAKVISEIKEPKALLRKRFHHTSFFKPGRGPEIFLPIVEE